MAKAKALFTGSAWHGTMFSGEVFKTTGIAKRWLRAEGWVWSTEDECYVSADGSHNVVAEIVDCELI